MGWADTSMRCASEPMSLSISLTKSDLATVGLCTKRTISLRFQQFLPIDYRGKFVLTASA